MSSSDWSGYEVNTVRGTDNLGRQTEIAFMVVREADGVSLGTYATSEDVDRVVAMDREFTAPPV